MRIFIVPFITYISWFVFWTSVSTERSNIWEPSYFSKLFGKIQCPLFQGQRVFKKIELACEWDNIPFLTQICTVILKIVLPRIVIFEWKKLYGLIWSYQQCTAKQYSTFVEFWPYHVIPKHWYLLPVDKFAFLGRLFMWSFNLKKKESYHAVYS